MPFGASKAVLLGAAGSGGANEWMLQLRKESSGTPYSYVTDAICRSDGEIIVSLNNSYSLSYYGGTYSPARSLLRLSSDGTTINEALNWNPDDSASTTDAGPIGLALCGDTSDTVEDVWQMGEMMGASANGGNYRTLTTFSVPHNFTSSTSGVETQRHYERTASYTSYNLEKDPLTIRSYVDTSTPANSYIAGHWSARGWNPWYPLSNFDGIVQQIMADGGSRFSTTIYRTGEGGNSNQHYGGGMDVNSDGTEIWYTCYNYYSNRWSGLSAKIGDPKVASSGNPSVSIVGTFDCSDSTSYYTYPYGVAYQGNDDDYVFETYYDYGQPVDAGPIVRKRATSNGAVEWTVKLTPPSSGANHNEVQMSTQSNICSDSSGNCYVTAAIGYNTASGQYMTVLWKLNSSGTTQWKKLFTWSGVTNPGMKPFSVRMDETGENLLLGGGIGKDTWSMFTGFLCKVPAGDGPTNGTWTFAGDSTEFPSGFDDGTIVVSDYSGTAASFSPNEGSTYYSSATYYWDATSTTYPNFTFASGTTAATNGALS